MFFFSQVNLLDVEDRTFQYGITVSDIARIPRGPYFIRQPVAVVFDLTRRKTMNQVTLSCIAGGYPTPEFQWYQEDFENDQLVSKRIDPLKTPRHTVSGGLLIINNPEEVRDRYLIDLSIVKVSAELTLFFFKFYLEVNTIVWPPTCMAQLSLRVYSSRLALLENLISSDHLKMALSIGVKPSTATPHNIFPTSNTTG